MTTSTRLIGHEVESRAIYIITLLLRLRTFNDVNGTFSYSSPDVNYFSGRHVVHGIVAILCVTVAFFAINFPCLLSLEPF